MFVASVVPQVQNSVRKLAQLVAEWSSSWHWDYFLIAAYSHDHLAALNQAESTM